MGWWELLVEFVKTNFTAIALAILAAALAVASGVTVHAMNRAADRRIERRASTGLNKHSTDELRKYLHFMEHAVSRRSGPQRWAMSRSDVAADGIELENIGHSEVFDVRVDLYARGPKSQVITQGGTLIFSSLPAGLPLVIPVGSPARASRAVMLVRWEDEFGPNHLERFDLGSIY